MADRSYGEWTITDVIGSWVPKKARLELTLEGDELRLRSEDGPVDVRGPASRCRYEAFGDRNGSLSFASDIAWLKTADRRAAADLEASLRLRYVPEPPRAAPAPDPDPTGPTFTKAYRAEQPADAAKAMTADAERFAGLGYALVSQSWADPDRSSQVALRVGGVLVFLFGLLFLAAIMVAIAIWVVALVLFIVSSGAAGQGSLLATFERREPRGQTEAAASPSFATSPASPSAAPSAPIGSARSRLLELTRLRDEGLITDQEWASKREELIRAL